MAEKKQIGELMAELAEVAAKLEIDDHERDCHKNIIVCISRWDRIDRRDELVKKINEFFEEK
jgi:hypothetical protein